jgi:hypothetical protein
LHQRTSRSATFIIYNAPTTIDTTIRNQPAIVHGEDLNLTLAQSGKHSQSLCHSFDVHPSWVNAVIMVAYIERDPSEKYASLRREPQKNKDFIDFAVLGLATKSSAAFDWSIHHSLNTCWVVTKQPGS